ncbi:MAG: hypothetical protein KDG50_06990 [Chromatiales bacterium]|nr:hypothetical protein [Chromatiales bacterium]
MNNTVLEFEDQIGLKPTSACRLMGVAYSTYAQYRSGRRDLPLYHEHHMRALLLLAKGELRSLILEYVDDL